MMDADALWSSLPIPSLLLDGFDVIVQSNPAAESFLNLSAKALVGAQVWDKVMIDAPLQDAYARARDGRTSLVINDVDVGSGMGAPMQCNVQISPLSGSDDLMLMMIDPDVHFHVLPRYDRDVAFEGIAFSDPGWPGPPQLGSSTEISESVRTKLLTTLRANWPA